MPLAKNCASSVLLLVVSVSAGFLGTGRALFNHLSIFPETSSGYTRLQGKFFDIVMLFRCWDTRGCIGLFLAVRVSYSIPWTVWKCKSDFYQMFLAYPRCHCTPVYPSLGIAAIDHQYSSRIFLAITVQSKVAGVKLIQPAPAIHHLYEIDVSEEIDKSER